MPVSSRSNPRNLINKIVSYKEVISVPNSVTLVEDMMPSLKKLAKIKPTRILNLVNDGYIEHKDILDAYKRIVAPNHTYIPISLAELQTNITKAKRSNCVLDNSKAKVLDLKLPELDGQCLSEIMEMFKKSLESIR